MQLKSPSHTQTGYLLMNLDCFGFWFISLEVYLFTRNETQEQPNSLLDTIFDYIFYFGLPGNYLYLSPQNLLQSAGEAGLHVASGHVGSLDFFIDTFLEIQDTKYS